MKARFIGFVLTLLPLSLHSYDGYDRCDTFKDDLCPITETCCPDTANFTVTNQPGFTFEDAVAAANASGATPQHPFVIAFDLPEGDDVSGSYVITKPVCIDGFSNPGAHEYNRKITLLFTSVSLTLENTACGSTIKGIRFDDSVVIQERPAANVFLRASHSRIYGNDFVAPRTTETIGILVDQARCVTIGGLHPHERNVIQGRSVGLQIRSSKTTVVGNYIGTNENGTRYALNNGSASNQCGLVVLGNCNFIGCKKKCGRNVISGNVNNVLLMGSHNSFKNNIVGLDVCGEKALVTERGTGEVGPDDLLPRGLTDSIDNTNQLGFILKGTYNKVSDSIFAGNLLRNVLVIDSTFNKIKNNFIGTNGRGTESFPTRLNMTLEESSSNCIEKNLISADSRYGLAVLNSNNNTIKHNIIGSDACKKRSLGQEVGILVSNGLLPELNITPGCLQALMQDDGQAEVFSSTSSTDLCGAGVQLEPSLQGALTLQSLVPSLGHVDSLLRRSSQAGHCASSKNTAHVLQPCTPCHPKHGFNQKLPGDGESVNTIIEENQILGNLRAGIVVSGARLTLIKENYIGVNKKCCIVSNGHGILFKSDTTLDCAEKCALCCSGKTDKHRIDERSCGCCDRNDVTTTINFDASRRDGAQCNVVVKNVIAGNIFNGIAVEGAPKRGFKFVQTFNNAFLKNAIFNNCQNGIRLNQCGNKCLQAPVILSAKRKGDQLTVEIDPASLPNASFMVEIYASRHCRPCITEGEFFVACKCVKEPLSGPLTITGELKCSDVKFASATVSELDDCGSPANTSEFSCPVCIQGKAHKSESLEDPQSEEAAEEEVREQAAKKTIEKKDVQKLIEESVETGATVPLSLRLIALR